MVRWLEAVICFALLTAIPAGVRAQETCTYSIAPANSYFLENWGGTIELQVSASEPSCKITAKSRYLWIDVAVRQEGSRAVVTIKVDGNDTLTHRIGAVSVGRHEVTITQAGPRRGGGQGS